MNKKFVVNNHEYVFDGNNLELYLVKDGVKNTDEKSCSSIFKKEPGKLYKLVFNVANLCNLNCKYCYASGGNYNRENNVMSFEQADKILEKVFKKYSKLETVYFFGGEPLLNFKLIKYLVEKIEKHYNGSRIDFRTVTNGMFLTPKRIDFMNDHNFKLYVSLDGPKQIHEYLRGTGTFDLIMDNLKYLKNKDFASKTEILCTYTRYHQEHITLEDLEVFFKKLGFRYSIHGVDTNDESLKLIEDGITYEESEKNFIDISMDRIINDSMNVGTSYYLTSVINALLFHNKQDYFCKELVNDYSNVFDYNGDEYSCIRFLGTHGKNDKEIKEKNVKSADVCKKCWCRYLCNLCLADIIMGINDYPFDGDDCSIKSLYEYALQKIVDLMEKNPSKLNLLVNNYIDNFIK